MSSSEAVLDASALLCYLQGEPGAAFVRESLARGCCMSAVNWAEALSKVAELGKSSRELIAELTARRLLGASLNIIPFTSEDAALAGDLRPLTRRLDLSLGDRACLALGRRLQTEVLTADRAWENLEETLRGPIKVIR